MSLREQIEMAMAKQFGVLMATNSPEVARWVLEGYKEASAEILHLVADDIEKTTIKIPFEAEGYIAGAKDGHAYIVKYLREQLDI